MVTDWLHRIHDRVTADSEAATEANGYLSYRAEWHSAAFGFAVAFLAVVTGRLEVVGLLFAWALRGSTDAGKLNLPYPKQFAKESAYLLGHMLPGAALGLIVRAGLAALGADVPALAV